MIDKILKHGVGYDLIVRPVDSRAPGEGHRTRLHLGIRCHTCNLTSFHPKDVEERYCGCCHRFHEEHVLAHEA